MQEKSKAPNDVRSQTAAPEPAERYSQDLHRPIGILGNTFITLIVILPQHGRAWNLQHAAVDEEA
jgi:hypothetical protein